MSQYSQNDEEKYILAAVGDKVGRFLDVGAYNASTFSNTRALAERGWSGVLVEPALGPFRQLLDVYGDNPSFVLLHALVGTKRGWAKFWNTDDALSTTEEGWHERWKAVGKYSPPYLMPMVTFDDILDEFGRSFDVINIDTEGTSVELFKAYPFSDRTIDRPMVVCVEHFGASNACAVHAAAMGYRCVYVNGENFVLVRSDL